MSSGPLLSVVMPVLNEAATIRTALEPLQLHRQRGAEIILADGGSDDDTVQLAAKLVDHVTVSQPGRARQMNAGAGLASAPLLLFLHADTHLPETGLNQLLVSQPEAGGNYWGRFDVRLDATGAAFRMIEWMMNRRSRLTGIATGDQAIFVTADLFRQVGGYADLPLMEDIDLSQRLRKHCRPRCFSERVTTSARRWQQRGVWRTVITMWWLRLAWFIGFDARRLVRWYYGAGHPAVASHASPDEG